MKKPTNRMISLDNANMDLEAIDSSWTTDDLLMFVIQHGERFRNAAEVVQFFPSYMRQSSTKPLQTKRKARA